MPRTAFPRTNEESAARSRKLWRLSGFYILVCFAEANAASSQETPDANHNARDSEDGDNGQRI
jgi:hypothetical protein